ncbi:hypothetical protein CgunFtcFv8_025024 [Champsocephalus gunnari]|uniref:Uncharacterized protein n=1 Tax=Champsocephalus gunnari TaxID=52237 RepID=A0AAN8HN12_CHAGU|nr:hypothetical protein CgunFtcFv8_025024 [Champsocephalus gunnari]
MRTILSELAESMGLSQPRADMHALFLKSKIISRFRQSGLICWYLETWLSSELPRVKRGFNHQATEYLLRHIWNCRFRAEVRESPRGNREEQGDKMEAKINAVLLG